MLATVEQQKSIIFRCLVCFEEYELTDTDTLLSDEYLQESHTIHKYRTYLQNAHADSIIELVHKKCPAANCPESIVHVVKIDQNGQVIHAQRASISFN